MLCQDHAEDKACDAKSLHNMAVAKETLHEAPLYLSHPCKTCNLALDNSHKSGPLGYVKAIPLVSPKPRFDSEPFAGKHQRRNFACFKSLVKNKSVRANFRIRFGQ